MKLTATLTLALLLMMATGAVATDLSKPLLLGSAVLDHFSGYGMQEVNPILGQSRARQAAITGASTAAVWYLSKAAERRGFLKLGKIMRYVTAFVHIGAGASNLARR